VHAGEILLFEFAEIEEVVSDAGHDQLDGWQP
jgi:hypothetical protein